MKQPRYLITADNAWRLIWIRSILILAQLGGIYYAYQSLRAPLAYDVLVMLLSTYTLLTFLSAVRLHWQRPVSATEYSLQLMADVLFLSFLVYFSGGPTNPFISLYIVFITISAAVLPRSATWLLAMITVVAYSYLLFFHQPIALMTGQGMDHGAHGSASQAGGLFNLHVLGMWLTFLVSTGLIAFFVSHMAQAIRTQDARLAEQRERLMQDEQLLAVATQAAGTAHELGTPLSTIAVVVNELRNTSQRNPELIEDLVLLEEQVALCKSALQKMVTEAEQEPTQVSDAVDFFNQALAHWQLIRPDSVFTIDLQLPHGTSINSGLALKQTVISLLNNAADASPSPEPIEISVAKTAGDVVLQIRDYGAGFSPDVLGNFGQPFISTKPGGMGLGLYLANATARRYNGRLELTNMPDGGALTELLLPVVNLSRRANQDD